MTTLREKNVPVRSGLLFLLLATGSLIGATFPLGKLAARSGVGPVLWAFIMSGGSAAVHSVLLAARRRVLPLRVRQLRYYVASGCLSYVAPNTLIFIVIPHLGAGYTAILFALSPILTTLLAVVLRICAPSRGGMIGVIVGFVGVIMIVLGRETVLDHAPAGWILLALAIPLFLACGNIYRTVDWPPGVEPDALVVGTNAAAALCLLVILTATHGLPSIHLLVGTMWLSGLQIFLSAAMFALFFQLQREGGPVYLSQIGYIASLVGVALSVSLLGEHYHTSVFAGMALVILGITISTYAQSTSRRVEAD